METRVRQWGNSLAIRIPKVLARELGLTEGQAVDLKVDGDSITIRPTPRARLSLSELLAGVTVENLHPETDWGPPVGREEW
ncbi:MAG: AbrB/MazE/SpoVT family DNA-binding domain-containing protein [Armatimonadetes bacterium]|nr:AbrB/MazE/SpoVT family DNA-binding domain-containing protein [Armatimonadota bacterium]